MAGCQDGRVKIGFTWLILGIVSTRRNDQMPNNSNLLRFAWRHRGSMCYSPWLSQFSWARDESVQASGRPLQRLVKTRPSRATSARSRRPWRHSTTPFQDLPARATGVACAACSCPGPGSSPAAADPTAPPSPACSPFDEFITAIERNVKDEGFFEQEINRRIDKFGAVVHVFSTYESRHAKSDAKPFVRGINSIQLFFDGKRWWVVTIFWDSERPDQPIPGEYLPRK